MVKGSVGDRLRIYYNVFNNTPNKHTCAKLLVA